MQGIEYRYKAKKADVECCGHPSEGEESQRPGPIQQRLANEFCGRVWGLVAGAMGEVSDDLQQLMRVMAERMAHKWKKRGARNMNEERAIAMMRIRRLIGIEALCGAWQGESWKERVGCASRRNKKLA